MADHRQMCAGYQNGEGLAVPSLIRGRNRSSGQMSFGFFDLLARALPTMPLAGETKSVLNGSQNMAAS